MANPAQLDRVGLHYYGHRYTATVLEWRKTRAKVAFRTKRLARERRPAMVRVVPVLNLEPGQHGLDVLTRTLTAFGSFREMVEAPTTYRPTIHLRDAQHVLLVHAYNQAQIRRGDPRRAYTGTNSVPCGCSKGYGCNRPAIKRVA